MSRLALILETPMSLQPEMCEHLAKDCLHAAERTEARRSRVILVAINIGATPQFGLRDLLLKINSAATAR